MQEPNQFGGNQTLLLAGADGQGRITGDKQI
jgi:hypothetical protein